MKCRASDDACSVFFIKKLNATMLHKNAKGLKFVQTKILYRMKNVLLFSFLALGILFSACSDDDDDNHNHNHDNCKESISIENLEPINNETVASPDDVHIHVRVSADCDFHKVEIELYPTNDPSDLILDFEEHAHSSSYDFERDLDLSGYPAGTEFELDVEVYTDHDGSEYIEKEIDFRIP